MVYQDSELSKEKQAGLQEEIMPNRVEAITNQNSSGDVSNIIPNNTLVDPQSLKRLEEDCTLREVDGMQGIKNSMKWKRKAREHAAKKATDTPIVKVNLDINGRLWIILKNHQLNSNVWRKNMFLMVWSAFYTYLYQRRLQCIPTDS